MDIFSGNKQLEAAVFTGIDRALFSRHNITGSIMPEILVFKSGHIIRQIPAATQDPNTFIDDFLRKADTDFEQVVIYMEGQVNGGDERKHDAMLVKAFDHAMPNGLLVGHRFIPLESGQPFARLGRPALLDNIPMPVPVAARTIAEPRAPYMSGLTAENENGSTRKVITAGHTNPSMLANELKIYAREILKETDSTFSGEIEIMLVPGIFTMDNFVTWLFNELITRIKEEPAVIRWERANNKQVQVTIQLNASAE
ncbi:hypothetical protein HNQ91_000066 [Filimonas zeae]|uniref:Uncharacterized protein n=1 Tax=Filimonas zeae TaxID=1737353 RepID=A0A917ILD6_9BACT|nr:hypothetical protein [Filimonas zeae]MDR6337044.1 hypothetical protein [Filimonas zeae]GGH56733.1 hypothetical protein GCM10011379_00650 [Filimonas zeae]